MQVRRLVVLFIVWKYVFKVFLQIIKLLLETLGVLSFFIKALAEYFYEL